MKKNKKLICLIGIVLILLIIIIVLFFKNGRPLSGKNKVVSELYSYVGKNDLEKCGGLIAYDKEKVNVDKLSKETKICLAYTLIDDKEEVKLDKDKKNKTCTLDNEFVFATDNYEDDICTINKIKNADISSKYKNMFGEELKDPIDFQLDGANICYYDNDNYYCGLSEQFTYTFGAEPHTYRAIKKAYKKGNKIIIYDYFLKTINDECYKYFTSDDKNDKCSKKLKDVKEVDYSFLKKYGSLYKHVFQKNGDTYKWVSSEIVN